MLADVRVPLKMKVGICIQNDESCIKNAEFCIKNTMNLVLQMMNFVFKTR